MAWPMLGAPGTLGGPCIEPCKHLDCQVNRRLAGSTCRFCEKPIGYGAKYCSDPWRLGEEIHLLCLMAEDERRGAIPKRGGTGGSR